MWSDVVFHSSVAVMTMLLVVAGAHMAAAQQEKRLGLVIGNGEYGAGPVPTAANDAGLIAQTLQASGFDVMGARDLDGDGLRNTFRDFVDKVSGEGPGSVVFVYLAGHGVQYEGENYFVPIDARIDRDVDVPIRALRLNDYVRPLASLNAKAVIVVVDAAREAPFVKGGQPLAGGLSLVEPAPGILWAFNAAPGTVAPMGKPPYGAYAQALAEMMREGGLSLDGVFERTRLRVNEVTSGAEVPWHASQVKAPFVFFERAADAPPEVSLSAAQVRRTRPIQAFDDAREAYLAALERDTLEAYLDFLRAYPDHALAKRVRAIVAARREAITWRRTRNADTPEAYWSYLDRYPNGPHAHDARRRLAFLTAPIAPPPSYVVYEYDLPPPPPEEIIYVRRPYVYFDDPVYAFVAPPPPPLFFLSRRVVVFSPPPPPVAMFVLPVPVFVPVPVYVRPPVYIAPPPPSNVVFRQLHAPAPPPPNPAAPGAKGPSGPDAAGGRPPVGGPSAGVVAAGVAAGAVAGAAAAAVALPPSVQKRAIPPGGVPAGVPGGAQTPPVAKTGIPVTPGAQAPPVGGPAPLVKGLPQAPPANTAAPGATPSAGKALPGSATGQPLPKAVGVTPPAGAPGQTPAAKGPPGVPPGAAQPKAATVTPPVGAPGLPPAAKGPPGAPGAAPGQPLPKSATGTPPPTSVPSVKGPGSPPAQALPERGRPPAGAVAAPTPPPAPSQTPRQQSIDRAAQDRAAVQQRLQQDRQRDLERRRQEQDAQARARQQNQLQDLQRQRQQQQDAQRRAMEQQRQTQQAQQAAARAQAEAQARARAAQQQQAAQAAARAQAEAQARARAAQQQKKCGAPGLPPCPR